MNFELPNYTGPYISDGHFQQSVEFGETQPKDDLDIQSRLHDSAYAHWEDRAHREAADSIYKENTKNLSGFLPKIAGNAVLYGNLIGRSAGNLVNGSVYGPIGLVAGALKNLYDLNDKLINGEKYKKEVLEYYKTDPVKSKNISNQINLPEQTQYAPQVQKPLKPVQYMPFQPLESETKIYNPEKLVNQVPDQQVTNSNYRRKMKKRKKRKTI